MTTTIILTIALVGVVILYFYTPKWLSEAGRDARKSIEH